MAHVAAPLAPEGRLTTYRRRSLHSSPTETKRARQQARQVVLLATPYDGDTAPRPRVGNAIDMVQRRIEARSRTRPSPPA